VHNLIRGGAAGLAVALLTAGCAASPGRSAAPPTSGAQTSSTGPTGSLQEPDVTAQEAQATALESVGGGWILETKIEKRDDDYGEDHDSDGSVPGDGDDDFEAPVDVWEVTVVRPDGLRHQVSVAMTDGSVLDSRVDD
jgi:hypothetical protein